MPDGFKVADAYVELTLDKDKLRRELESELADLPRQAAPAAERGGRDLGDKIGRGMSDAVTRSAPGLAKAVGDSASKAGERLQAAVEQWSARVAKARRAEVEATQSVELATKRLNEARLAGAEQGSARELAASIALERAQNKLADAQRNVTTSAEQQSAAQAKLADFISRAATDAGPAADRGGQGLGDKLSQGMSMALMRNSPLIVAAIGAILAVGAPLMAVAGTALFAGLGIASAAQSDAVKSAWLGTWQSIKDGAQAAAGPVEEVVIRMAGRVRQAFDDLPLGEAFAAAAPHIAIFTEGIIALAENAMPGMIRSMAEGQVVSQGFADFLAKTGTGLSDFFDRITDHAPAAGQVWSQLGDSFAVLLPLLGELVGQGAELATMVLPVMNSGLGLLLSAVTAIGPALPALVAGFGAMKIVQSLGGWVSGLGRSLAEMTPRFASFAEGVTGSVTAGERVQAGMGRAQTAVAAFGRALPIVGIAVGAVAGIMADATQRTDGYAQAMIAGGAAARKAAEDLANPGVWESITTSFKNIFESETWTGGGESPAEAGLRNARERVRELEASMNPLELAKSRLAGWTATLNDRLMDESASAEDVAIAQRKVAEYSRKAANEQEALERATRGVTQAMVDQADQARALVDQQFAYENSINGVEDAQAALAEAQAHLNDENEETRTSMEDVSRAALGLNEAYAAQVAAAEALATSALPASMDENQKKIIGAKAALDELNALIAFGVVLPPSMEEYRQSLMRITGEADGAMLATATMNAAVTELGYAVTNLPDGKGISITGVEADRIAPMRDTLRSLGFDVITLPDGKTVEVRALTEAAKGNVDEITRVLTELGIKVAEPQVNVNPQPVIDGAAAAGGAVDALGAKTANPLADLADDPLVGAALADLGLLGNLGAYSATPAAGLLDDPLVNAALEDLGLLGNLAGQTPTPVAGLSDGALVGTAANDQAILANLNAQRPTPLADLYDDPLIGGALYSTGLLGDLAGQRPTPVALLDDGPLRGSADAARGNLSDVGRQRPTPVIDAWDWASGVARGVQNALANIRDKTVVITAINKAVNQVVNGFGQIIGATGGQVGDLGPPPPGSILRALGGQVRGPGTTTSDGVGPFSVAGGRQAYLSDKEWIIQARSALGYGHDRMRAVNNGTARILLPNELDRPLRRAVGGPLADIDSRLESMRSRMSVPAPAPSVQGQTIIRVENITLKVETPMNLMSQQDLRKAAKVLRDALIGLESETA